MAETQQCHCCGRRPSLGATKLTKVDGGDMHFRCWNEHHSDPTGPWPEDHRCAVERAS